MAEPAPAPSSAVEAPRLKPAPPSSLFDLSDRLVGRLSGDGVVFRSVEDGAEVARHAVPRAAAIAALPDGSWVVLADGGGRTVYRYDVAGAPTGSFTVPEAPTATRLLADDGGFWIATTRGAVRYPVTPTMGSVYVSTARLEKEPPSPVSLTRLADGALAGVLSGAVRRWEGEAAKGSWPLPKDLAAPVRLAAGQATDEVWLAPWTGALRRARLGDALEELVSVPTQGNVWAVDAAGGVVAALELELADAALQAAGPGTWRLRVFGEDGAVKLELVLPSRGARVLDEAPNRGLRLSPDGKVVAVGGPGELGAWRVADGGVVVALGG